MQVHQITNQHKILFMNKLTLMLLFAAILILLNSCYYDNEETLYPNAIACDTSNVKYSTTIVPILQTNCNGCHSQTSPSGNIVTDNYSSVKIIVDNGKLNGTINHIISYSPMPKGGNKLTNCELAKFRIWISNGAPNN